MTTLYSNFMGIDIGKFDCVAHIYGSNITTTFKNTREGIAEFYTEVKASLEKGLVVCEVTGGYERLVIEYLQSHTIAVHRANGRQIKNFIRSYGIIGKNDSIDAKALSHYAYERHPRLALYEKNTHETLRELQGRRADLVSMHTAEKNRKSAPGGQSCVTSIDAVIAVLATQISLVEAQIKELIASDAILQMKVDTLKTLPGVGDITAATIVCQMPEIGTMNQKQVASLAGLAPHPNQSGMKNGYRRTRGGRRHLRAALHMSGLSASGSKSVLGDFYRRLVESGKPKMCALTAVTRKLIVIANARVKVALTEKDKQTAMTSQNQEVAMMPA